MEYYSNINLINEDVESFVIAKQKIESKLIEEKKIEKKMSIKDFLEYIKITNTFIYMKNQEMKVVAFYIYNIDDKDTVIMFSSDNDEAEKEFKNILKTIRFNLKNLIHYNQLDVLNGKLENKPYFIINNEFYSI